MWMRGAILIGVMVCSTTAVATPAVGITTETLGTRFTTAVATGSYAHSVTSAGSNRALVVTVGTTSSTVTISSVVWDPDTTVTGNEQTLSCPVASMVVMGTSRRIAICTLLTPTISTGNGQITVNFSGGTDTFTSSATTFTGIAGFRTAASSPANKTFSTWTGCGAVSGGYSCFLTAVTQADDVVFDIVGQGEPDPAGSRSFTAAAGQTKHEDQATLPTGAGPHLRVATSVAIATGTSTTMTWTYGSATSSNGVGHVALPMIAASTVTAATMGTRTAVNFGLAGTRVAWRTEEEASHLGFYVWRDSNGRRTRITKGLIPGSTFTNGNFPLAGPRDYVAWDDGAKPGARYWLEEIPTRGPSKWHGPIVPSRGTLAKGLALRRLAAPPATFADPVATPSMTPLSVTRPPVVAAASAALCANPPAGGAAIKIGISTTGWYHIEAGALQAAGLPAGADPAHLALFADGQPIALRALGQGMLDAIEFYGQGLDTAETATHVYWLVAGSAAPRPVDLAAPGTPSAPIGSYSAEVIFRERTVYLAALLNGPADNFFGAVLSTTPVTQTIQAPDPIQDQTATLEVALQGATADTHQVDVTLNGSDLGVLSWTGQAAAVQTLAIPMGLLVDGANQVLLTPGATNGVALVDHLTLRYQRPTRAFADQLEAPVPAGATVALTGFSRSDVQVFDVTDPSAPLELTGALSNDGTAYTATVTLPPGTGVRILRAQSSAGGPSADSIAANIPSSICGTPGAELAIVAPRMFFGALAPLVAARVQAGWTVELDDVEDVFDEMSYGAHHAAAITNFVRLRHAGSAPRTKYLLMVGGASFDPRNFLGKGIPDLVPTQLIDTDAIETASDESLADLDGDGLAEVAVGRWPARTVDEVSALVTATLALDGHAPFDRGALIVTGTTGDPGFQAAALSVTAALPAAPDLFDAAGLDSADALSGLVAHWAASPSYVQYFGHGSEAIWEDLLSNDDVDSLGQGGQRAVVLAMTCLNGFFQDVYQDCLAERLLQATSGAVAVWASADLYDAGAQGALATSFAQNVQKMALGMAVHQARVATGGAGRAMVLFGDPTLFGAPTPSDPNLPVISEPPGPTPITSSAPSGSASAGTERAAASSCAVGTGNRAGWPLAFSVALGLVAIYRRRRGGR
ncbi:MAG TPA: C25 family cysteine peptidase [Polyangia bacterium]|nr:C25 family cysteine peptidase [Polyangia bacterium]